LSTGSARREARDDWWRAAVSAVLEDQKMSFIRRFDHVGITVADLDTVTEFFVGLGFESRTENP